MFSGGDDIAIPDFTLRAPDLFRTYREIHGGTLPMSTSAVPLAGGGIGDWMSANSSSISGGAAIAESVFQIIGSFVSYFSKKSAMEFQKDTITSKLASEDRMTEANKTAQLDKEDRKVALARDLEKIQKEYNAATVQRKENEDKLQITVAGLGSADKVDALKKETSKSIFDSRSSRFLGEPVQTAV